MNRWWEVGTGQQARIPAINTVPTAGKSGQSRQAGVTLVELITVIVILGIISVIGSQFIVSATESYRATQSRALLANTGRQAVERMTRQLRGALPYSVRLTNSGNCVQFMPVAAAGFYRQPVPLDTAISSLSTSPYSIGYYPANYLVLGALSSDEIYNGVARTGGLATNPTSVGFNPITFVRNSEAQRFYLVAAPQAFCLDNNGRLQYYSGLDPDDDDVGLGAPNELLARNAVTIGDPIFTVNNATAENNIIVNINIGFSEGGETANFFQEVSLRNVP